MFWGGFDSKADYALTLFGNIVILFHLNGKQQKKIISCFSPIFLLLHALFILTKM